MSIQALCSIHELMVYDLQIESGDAMSQRRTYVPMRRIKCRVMPQGSGDVSFTSIAGAVISHEIRFYFDPELKDQQMVKWLDADMVMRCVGLPVEPHGLGRMWRVLATTQTIDNPELFENVV